jgi:glycosyltransferase involved in cell wall biosynthesis
LHLAGAATAGDEPLIRRLRARIESAGLAARVTWSPNISREEKISFLRGLSLFSVPATYAEAFGLYVVEAMACGVPVVQPEAAAFPELIAAGGGGLGVRPRDPAALAHAWRDLLRDPARRAELGRAGRAAAEAHFSSAAMAAAFRREIAVVAGKKSAGA